MPVGVLLTGDEGFVTVESETRYDPGDNYDWILEHHPAVSPETHEVDEAHAVDIGFWQMGYTTGTGADREARTKDLFRYKVKVRSRRPGKRLTNEHVAELIKLVRRRKPLKLPEVDGAGEWLVFCLADLQIGKSDYGGTKSMLERVEISVASLIEELKGRPYEGIVIVDPGDICEGTSCFYDNQSYSIELNQTQQIAVATDLFLSIVERVLPLVNRVLCAFAPSNHGEFRTQRGGGVMTDRARDNVDLVIADSLARVFRSNPERYGRVEVWTPPQDGGDPYVVTLDLSGVLVGFTHGHQVTAVGAGRMAKLEKWWQNQRWSDGRRLESQQLPTAADCDILVAAHGHTFMLSDATGRLLVQCPAAEDGSEWFETSQGNRSGAGVLSFRTGASLPLKANDFVIR